MVSKNSSQFTITKQLFIDYLIGYEFPISYEEWYHAEDDQKAALLFVNFYKEIVLAWSKWVVPFLDTDEGVSIAMQYITKQITRLNSDPKLFTPQYFYRVMWNAFGSVIKSKVVDKRRSELEISRYYNETDCMGTSVCVDLGDLMPSYDDDYEVAKAREAVWNIIESLGLKAEKVVNKLLNPKDSLKRQTRNIPAHQMDRLRDVTVSPEEYVAIMATLELALEPYLEYFA